MGAQGFGRRAGQRRALTGAPALMPELLVLALAAAGRVPDDGCFAAAAARQRSGLQEHSGLIPGVDGQDLIGRTDRLRGRELDGVQSHADPIRLIASLAARCSARRVCDLV